MGTIILFSPPPDYQLDAANFLAAKAGSPGDELWGTVSPPPPPPPAMSLPSTASDSFFITVPGQERDTLVSPLPHWACMLLRSLVWVALGILDY